MLYLISYDVSTICKLGRSRLRRVAKTCVDHGIRVQNSVFECELNYEEYLTLREKLKNLIDPSVDSLRFYPLGKGGREKVVHIGCDRGIDVEGSLIV